MVMVQKVQQPATLFGTTTVRSQVACQVHTYILYVTSLNICDHYWAFENQPCKCNDFFIFTLS